MCTEELTSAPKSITFWADLPLEKKFPGESNLIPYPEYLYLLLSVFFVDLNAPSKQFSKAKSKLLTFELNWEMMYMFTIVLCDFILF